MENCGRTVIKLVPLTLEVVRNIHFLFYLISSFPLFQDFMYKILIFFCSFILFYRVFFTTARVIKKIHVYISYKYFTLQLTIHQSLYFCFM